MLALRIARFGFRFRGGPAVTLTELFADPSRIDTVIEAIATDVLRSDLSRPGFHVLDLGTDGSNLLLRRLMLVVCHHLSAIVEERGASLRISWLGRFDQQRTTEAHRDGGPPDSLLVLGYEPTPVPSRLFFVDVTRAAVASGLTPAVFLERFNPITREGQAALAGHETEVPFPTAHYRLAVINNSTRSPEEGSRTGMLGVLHKAIVEPRPGQERGVNTMLLVVPDDDFTSPYTKQQIESFLASGDPGAAEQN
jgi:hypothetical protein